MRLLAAHCHLGMGELRAASALYEEMGMVHWLKRARAAQTSAA